MLLVRTVPLLQKLPKEERQKILRDVRIQRFEDGDYIIKQGDIGEEFFIIQEGSVKVVQAQESRNPDSGKVTEQFKTLVTLREGHVFGEMALFSDQPRVASVISVKMTICLVLSKRGFKSALSEGNFKTAMDDTMNQRVEIRKARAAASASDSGDGGDSTPGTPGSSITADSGQTRRSSFYKSFYNKSKSTRSSLSSTGEAANTNTVSITKGDGGTRAVNNYVLGKMLGKGQYGDVYLCTDKITGKSYAMKQMKKPRTTGWDGAAAMNSIRQEINVMRRIAHENIVSLHEVIDDPNQQMIYLIQELMGGGALMPDAETCDPLDVTLCRGYFRDIVRGVAYLHSEGIVHRDIKPQNALKTKPDEDDEDDVFQGASPEVVKIADFGAAVFMNSTEKIAFQATPHFMAPELFLTDTDIDFSKTPKIDVFALGATLFFMVVGRPPWSGKNAIELATQIKNIELTFPNAEKYDPHLKHLCRQMLWKDYESRCTLDDVVVDDWVTMEGAEPLFEDDDYDAYEAPEDASERLSEDIAKVMIIDSSIITRKMLALKINSIKGSVVAGYPTSDKEEILDKINYSIKSQEKEFKNFDYIFTDSDMALIKDIKATGFAGKIISTNSSLVTHPDIYDFVDVVIMKPFSRKDIISVFETDDLREVAENLLQHAKSGTVTESEERSDFKDTSVAAVMHTPPSARSDSGSSRGGGYADEENIKEDNELITDYERVASMKSMHSLSSKDGSIIDAVTPNPKGSTKQKGMIRRNKGFVIVRRNSRDKDAADDDGPGLDRPLKLFFVDKNDKAEKRRRKQEAMMMSKVAHKFRQEKKKGADPKDLENGKSLLTLMRTTSGRVNSGRKSFTLEDGETLKAVAEGAPNSIVTMEHIDMYINNTVSDPNNLGCHSEDGGEGVRRSPQLPRSNSRSNVSQASSTASFAAKMNGVAGMLDDPDSAFNSSHDVDDDSDDGSVLESSEDGSLDFGTIKQNDDLDDIFGEVISTVEAIDINKEMREWNHIMILTDHLAKSITGPAEKTKDSLGLIIGCHEEFGPRPYMEDRIFYNLTEETKGGRDRCPLAVFGVFDGHSGDDVVQRLQDRFSDRFCSILKKWESATDFTKIHSQEYESGITQVFRDTCSSLDREILTDDYERQCKTIKTGNLQTFSGSVGVMAAVMPVLPSRKLGRQSSDNSSVKELQCFVAWVGDCRAVGCEDGNAIELSIDHKPGSRSETQRIIAAGGVVSNGRVHGSLGCSRSFGDIQFKGFDGTPCGPGGEEAEGGIWFNAQVFSKPDVMSFKVKSSTEFMIMASDGLWDMMSNQEVTI